MDLIDKLVRVKEELVMRAKTAEGQNRLDDVRFYGDGYAEPGYDEPESGIIASGNWNHVTSYNKRTKQFEVVDDTIGKLAKVLEVYKVDMVWSDEWAECDDCRKLVRTSPDSYGWEKSYWAPEYGGIYCVECIGENVGGCRDELVEWLVGNERAALSGALRDEVSLMGYGFMEVEAGFEHGFHRGQDADPKVIAKSLRKRGVERFIFVMDYVGQFDVRFSVWVHEEDFGKVGRLGRDETDGPSVSGAMESSLKEASRQMGELSGEGIRYAKVTPDKVKVRIVSPEEFVRGIKE